MKQQTSCVRRRTVIGIVTNGASIFRYKYLELLRFALYEATKMYGNISVAHEGLKSHDVNDRSRTREQTRLSKNFHAQYVCGVCAFRSTLTINPLSLSPSVHLGKRVASDGVPLGRLPGANLILCCRAARNTRYSLQLYHVSVLTCAG